MSCREFRYVFIPLSKPKSNTHTPYLPQNHMSSYNCITHWNILWTYKLCENISQCRQGSGCLCSRGFHVRCSYCQTPTATWKTTTKKCHMTHNYYRAKLLYYKEMQTNNKVGQATTEQRDSKQPERDKIQEKAKWTQIDTESPERQQALLKNKKTSQEGEQLQKMQNYHRGTETTKQTQSQNTLGMFCVFLLVYLASVSERWGLVSLMPRGLLSHTPTTFSARQTRMHLNWVT